MFICKNKVLHRHVRIVFWRNLPIAIPKLTNFLSHGCRTFVKRYWFVEQKYNKHVSMKDLFLHKPEQKHR